MGKDLGGARSVFWVVVQTPFHQAYGFRRSSRNYFLQGDAVVFWHLVQFAVSKAFGIWPVVWLWFAQDPRNLFKLVHLGTAREQRLKCVQLSHYAPESKNVHWVVIASTTKHIFRCTVPPRANVLSKWRLVSNFLDEAKITDFCCCFALN